MGKILLHQLKATSIPTINTITDNKGLITGTVAANGISDDSTLLLSGKADAGNKIKIFDKSVNIGSAIVDKNGNWQYTTNALTDGSHAFSAAGNNSSPSAVYSVIVDTNAPTLTISTTKTILKANETTKVTFSFSEAASF